MKSFIAIPLLLLTAAAPIVTSEERIVQFKATGSDVKGSYVAAVYEHRPEIAIVKQALSRESLKEVLNTYERVAQQAAEQGANIVVFPEDGLMGFGTDRSVLYPYLELLPPENTMTNPCDEVQKMERKEIQHRLSCMAKTHNIYIVANVGSVVFCETAETCPPDGRFQYNTNVVFDNFGNLISYYHKWNLFYEDMFDFPAGPEYATFETPFGKFATIVCFDVLFKEPAVDLVEQHGVTTAILPTAWGSKLPLMSGIGYHESWARRMGVNLLTSELHVPEIGFVGSGIFSGADGALAYSNKHEAFSEPELVIANLSTSAATCKKSTLPPLGNNVRPNKSQHFYSMLQKNNSTFVLLSQDGDNLNLISQNTTCSLEYKFEDRNKEEMYAFGIFEGLHISSLNSSIQFCALVKCANTSPQSCGAATREVKSTFSYINLQGQFSTNYIFPAMLTNGGNLVKDWDFTLDESNNRARVTANTTKPMLSAILYTRVFSKDHNVRERYYHKVTSFKNGDQIESSSAFSIIVPIAVVILVITVAGIACGVYKQRSRQSYAAV